MSENIVEAINLKKNFSGNTVLKDFSIGIKKGAFVSLLGPSGCGKTVFLKILSKLLQKNSGDIKYNFAEEKNINISFAFQRSPLFPWLNIFENIKICMNNKNSTEGKKDNIAIEYLRKAHLEEYKDYFPHEISGGMRQKVNILRCFCCQSELILMDEPFVFLDFIQRRELQAFTLKIWEEEKKTILFITHDINEAIVLSDTILLMSTCPGKIIKQFNVNLPRPRNVKEAIYEKNYLKLFTGIDKCLSEEIIRAQNPTLPIDKTLK